MARENEEVAIQVLHIDGMVGDGLCAVDDHGDAILMRHFDHFLHRVNGTQNVRDVRN